MGLVHSLSDCLVIAFGKGIADIKHPLLLSYHIMRSLVVFLGNPVLDGIQLLHCRSAQELLAESLGHPLAGSAAVIVRRAYKLVLYTGIQKHQTVSVLARVKREIFIFQRTAVQTDKVAFLSENGSELVHYAAVDSAIVVLGSLPDLRKFELVDTEIEKIIEGECERAFKGSGR